MKRSDAIIMYCNEIKNGIFLPSGSAQEAGQVTTSRLRPPRFDPVVAPSEPPELDPEDLTLLDVLGEGFFGVVLKGELRSQRVDERIDGVRRAAASIGLALASSRHDAIESTVKTVVD